MAVYSKLLLSAGGGIVSTMQQAEQQLERYHFVRCNHWYLVNLRHVTEVRRDTVMVAGQELEISRRNHTAFLTALTNYVGGDR